jgi:hypothetical protein
VCVCLLQGNRGCPWKISFVDEFTFSADALLSKSVFPALAVRGVACIMITTPGDSECFGMRLVTQLDKNGNPLIPVLYLGQPCKTCIDNNNPLACQHNWHHCPAWKDPELMTRLRPLWSGDAETDKRENLGMLSSLRGAGFTTKMIEDLRNSEPLRDKEFRPRVVYMTVDVSAGGESEDSYVASYVNDDKLVV